MAADNNTYLTGLCSRRVIFMKLFRWKYYSLSFALFQTACQPPSRAASFLPGPACRSYSEVNLEPPWARQSRAETEKANLWPWGQHEGPLRDPTGIIGFPSSPDLFSSYLGIDRKQRVSQFQSDCVPGVTAKAPCSGPFTSFLGFVQEVTFSHKPNLGLLQDESWKKGLGQISKPPRLGIWLILFHRWLLYLLGKYKDVWGLEQ